MCHCFDEKNEIQNQLNNWERENGMLWSDTFVEFDINLDIQGYIFCAILETE